MPRISWQTIFICGKPQRYDKPLKQLGLLSRQADIRRVTGASSVNLRQGRASAKAMHGDGATASDVLNYLSREFRMTVRPNHLGMALQRHRRAGQLENRNQRWYVLLSA